MPNQPLETAQADLFQALLELANAVGSHHDSMFDGAPLNAPFLKACAVLERYAPPAKELKDATEHEVWL